MDPLPSDFLLLQEASRRNRNRKTAPFRNQSTWLAAFFLDYYLPALALDMAAATASQQRANKPQSRPMTPKHNTFSAFLEHKTLAHAIFTYSTSAPHHGLVVDQKDIFDKSFSPKAVQDS